MSKFKIKFITIPSIFGGLQDKLYENIRIGIVWQKYRSENLNNRYDISLTNIQFDEKQNLWEADCHSIQDLPTIWLQKEELIELVNTYNTIAVGKIY